MIAFAIAYPTGSIGRGSRAAICPLPERLALWVAGHEDLEVGRPLHGLSADTAPVELTPRRHALLRNGYAPIPVNGKVPHVSRWSEIIIDSAAIDSWPRFYADHLNTGARTQYMPTFDGDILIPEAADAVYRLIRDRYQEHGPILLRFGQRPKFAILFRTDTPFDKIKVKFVPPGGTEPTEGIEFLGDGQQVVIDGIHPGTGQPYEWWNDAGPLQVPHAELPYITETEVKQLVCDIVELLIAEHGYTLPKEEEEDQRKAERPTADGPASDQRGSGERYASAALEAECAKLARATKPGRNDQLNASAFSLGQLVGAGLLSESEVRSRLRAASGTNGLVSDPEDGPASVRKTMDSGITAGMKQPRGVPPRQEWSNGHGPDIGLDQPDDADKQQGRSTGHDDADEDMHRQARQPGDGEEVTQDAPAATTAAPVVLAQIGTDVTTQGVSLDDFYAYMPMHSYIYTPTREMWPAGSVNARIPPIQVGQDEMKASLWLDQNKPVEQMTWAPGLPMLVENRLISQGGWIDRNGVRCFNLYRPPIIKLGEAASAAPWLEHVRRIYPDDADHIIKWFAHRVQRPHDKINHALVLGGKQGIGKDTMVEPVKRGVGPWNFDEVNPRQILGRFNSFVKSVILRVSEARDLGDFDRFQLYDCMKVYTAAPPDVLRVDEKHIREYSVPNCCGVIITTNNKTDGIYLPADDRRHFVAWSNLAKEDFTDEYWNAIWAWLDNGGDRLVAAYLAQLDIRVFNAKAPPPKTPAFWDIVDANRAPEDAETADLLDLLGNPDAASLSQITNAAEGDFAEWLKERKNRRAIPHRLEKCGYTPVRNDAATDGLWKIFGKRQVIYAKTSLSIRDRIAAARELT